MDEPALPIARATSWRELRRDPTDRRVAGVCVMLADHWRVDPLLVRVVALLLALSSGIGVTLYVTAWLVVPTAGSDRAPIDQVFPAVRRLGPRAGIALLVILCFVVGSMIAPRAPFRLGPAIVIGAVWFFGWYRPRRKALRAAAQPTAIPPAPFTSATPFTQAAAVWQTRMGEYLHDQGPQQGAYAPAPLLPADPGYTLEAFLAHPDPAGLYGPAPLPVPEIRAAVPPAAPAAVKAPTWAVRIVRLIAWASLLIAPVSVVYLFRIELWQSEVVAYPAAALLMVGLALVVSAWTRRRHYGLTIIGFLLMLMVGALLIAERIL